MVMNKFKWSARPTVSNRRFLVVVKVHQVQDLVLKPEEREESKLFVDVKWKGPKGALGSRFRKSAKKSRTYLQPIQNGVAAWDEEFSHDCIMVQSIRGGAGGAQEVTFQPWDVNLVVRKAAGNSAEKAALVGTSFADLANFASLDELAMRTETFPVFPTEGSSDVLAFLTVTVELTELRDDGDAFDGVLEEQSLSVCTAYDLSSADLLSGPALSADRSNSRRILSSDEEEGAEVLFDEKVDEKVQDEGELSDAKDKLLPAIMERAEKAASRPSSYMAFSNFLPKSGRVFFKEEAGGAVLPKVFGGGQGKGRGGPFTSFPKAAGAGEETEEEDSKLDDSLRYGRIAGVNLAVHHSIHLPALIPLSEGSAESSGSGPGSPMGIESPSGEQAQEEEGEGGQLPVQGLSKRFTFGVGLFGLGPAAKPPPLDVSDDALLQPQVGDQLSDEESPAQLGTPGGAAGVNQKVPGSGGFLTWKKRKLNFKSPKTLSEKGEPLLNKAYGEEGGDEIDWDRRQAEEAEAEHPLCKLRRRSSADDEYCSLFGEKFSVGTWERRRVISRDRRAFLLADVFFASFDQCNARVGGDGACTALVAVVSEWLHAFPGSMPTKAELDTIIREGSAEWRRLCEVEAYKELFPDKHFDLETVVQASEGRLRLVADRSFVGFFRPEVASKESNDKESKGSGPLDFLDGTVAFESMWEEVEKAGPGVYIVSWNDHFFVLGVEVDCCYIIDTLGERLYEGCNQAYMLRFDSTTVLEIVEPSPTTTVPEAPKGPAGEVSAEARGAKPAKGALVTSTPQMPAAPVKQSATEGQQGSKAVRPTRSPMSLCGQFVKEFYAAVPLQELGKEIQRGQGANSLHRLQVELHYTVAGEAVAAAS